MIFGETPEPQFPSFLVWMYLQIKSCHPDVKGTYLLMSQGFGTVRQNFEPAPSSFLAAQTLFVERKRTIPRRQVTS
jgi:hypothetical protein